MTTQWRNEPKHLGGTIFARERSDRAGGRVWEGVSPGGALTYNGSIGKCGP